MENLGKRRWRGGATRNRSPVNTTYIIQQALLSECWTNKPYEVANYGVSGGLLLARPLPWTKKGGGKLDRLFKPSLEIQTDHRIGTYVVQSLEWEARQVSEVQDATSRVA